MGRAAKVARRRQALEEIQRLQGALDQWYQEKTELDQHADGTPRGQYRTQLKAIHTEVAGAADLLRSGVEDIDAQGATGSVYQRCTQAERQTVWLWRVWGFFRDKFDQRQDPRYSAVLKAADEVVWSCHRPFFSVPATRSRTEPAPLPYIETEYSPEALRRDRPRVLAKKRTYQLVADAFDQLPVPILKIPITAVGSPWALALIGHEVGHFVRPLVSTEFLSSFGQGLTQAVDTAGGGDEDQRCWQLWAEEVFADWYSILTLGPWAIWAMAQFETGETDFMATRRRNYPSPAVRLALMAALAEHHGLPGQAMLAGCGIEPPTLTSGNPDSARDLEHVPALVSAITRPLPDSLGRLEDLLLFNPAHFQPAGRAAQWAGYLMQTSGATPPSRKLSSARLAAAGCVEAWSRAVFGAASEPTDGELESLRQRSLVTIQQAAEPGVRSVLADRPRGTEPGRRLVALLATADEE